MKVLLRYLLLSSWFGISGCASYPLNAPLEQIDTEVGYRLNNRALGDKNSDDLYVILGRPYVHLLDSGISDNIGIRSPALIFSVREAPASQIQRIEDGTIKKLAIILVDAKPKTHFKGDLKPKPPGLITSVQTSASRPLANYSYETVNILKQAIRSGRADAARYNTRQRTCEAHSRSVCTNMELHNGCYESVVTSCFQRFKAREDDRPVEPEIYMIHISFESIEEDEKRGRYESIPAKLELPQEDIDLLIDVAPELINKTPEFHLLLQDLDARIVN